MDELELFKKVDALVDTMKEEFDSHWFILKLAQANQSEYVDALVHYKSSFQILHGEVSRAIGATGKVENIGSFSSLNIWQEKNPCAKWKKVPKTV